ncbi:hypothetical protein [Streptomyces sp. NPDC058326]|uniref:hypothetical protein n=1 Tax=Streptomyces sp. NPDC058326 TaxID=3346447 RepID=UPI0036EA6F61
MPEERRDHGLEEALRAALRADRGAAEEPTAGTAGTPRMAGKAGTSGKAGSAGTPGKVGTPSTAGTTGEAGSAGTTGKAGGALETGTAAGGSAGERPGREAARTGGEDAEASALAAFRAAREAGLHTAGRTRRRDDWTPGAGRRRRRSLRAAAAALASVALGGVAIAAVDLPGRLQDDPVPVPAPAHEPRRYTPRATEPVPPEAGVKPTVPSAGPALERLDRGPEGLPGKHEREALCHAYGAVTGEKKEQDKERALRSPAWQRLVVAAGGEENVAEYCGQAPLPGDGTGARNSSKKPMRDARNLREPKGAPASPPKAGGGTPNPAALTSGRGPAQPRQGRP